jgi:hypothetical protein
MIKSHNIRHLNKYSTQQVLPEDISSKGKQALKPIRSKFNYGFIFINYNLITAFDQATNKIESSLVNDMA